MEVAGDELQTEVMDHHGIVAAVCEDLGIANKINQRMGRQDPRRIVTTGTAAVALILNGLGFTNRRLYLTPQFFASKPVQRLLGVQVSAKHLDDHALGKALDEIASYGSSRLFGEIAFEIALENHLVGGLSHLDSTSLSVEGQYDVEDAAEAVELSYGHSKDQRPDLKQVIMNLVVNGPASIPLWMEPHDGNSSDKKTFHETIKRVQAFKEGLKGCPDFKWVADSALYSKDKLLKQTDYLWLSRVPETINEARSLVEQCDMDIPWKSCGESYKVACYLSTYGEVTQRWLLVYSEANYQREKKTFERKLAKQDEALEKALWHLGNDKFQCEEDAKKAAAKLIKQYPYHDVTVTIEPIKKHAQAGRPRKGVEASTFAYEVKTTFTRHLKAIKTFLNRKGRFILATNDMDERSFPNEKILKEYKKQQNVERGFRFLKDPWFMVDSIFLKSPRRIEALMMVMTLCLLVYNVAQYRLRENLKENKDMLPNQINKPIQNPTLRWIFQIMEGIGIVNFYQQNIRDPIRQLITNLTDLRKKIITLFGPSAKRIYGIP